MLIETIKPNDAFEYVRADEVAECWEGVTTELYHALWCKIVPLQKPLQNMEDSGPADHIGEESLASHWDALTHEQQAQLNALAERNVP